MVVAIGVETLIMVNSNPSCSVSMIMLRMVMMMVMMVMLRMSTCSRCVSVVISLGVNDQA